MNKKYFSNIANQAMGLGTTKVLIFKGVKK